MKQLLDFKLLKILALFYTITSIISLLKKVYLKIKGFAYEFYEWQDMILEGFVLDWVVIMLFMTGISMTTKLMMLKNIQWKYIIAVHFVFSLLMGAIIYLFNSLVYLLSGQITLSELDLSGNFASIVSVADLNFLIYFSMICIVYTFYYFKKNQTVELEKSQLSNQLINVKMNVLKYKLHPHFLFNTLNSISSLIETDTKLAQNTIADFGDLLRDLLDLKDTNLIPLKEEISISKRYLDIMSLRFSDHLNVSINIDKSLYNENIPSLILLPIIENSIKHGYSLNVTNLSLDLKIFKKNNTMVILISNNGENLKSSISYGNGIQNTIDRLKTIYQNDYKYIMKNNVKGQGITTNIVLPLH